MDGGRGDAQAFEEQRGSYLSSHDPREILGIGKAAKIDWLEIIWPAPSKNVERLTNLPIDKYIIITERTP